MGEAAETAAEAGGGVDVGVVVAGADVLVAVFAVLVRRVAVFAVLVRRVDPAVAGVLVRRVAVLVPVPVVVAVAHGCSPSGGRRWTYPVLSSIMCV
ncbi:hypothetical protein GCM10010254_16920 [Streptomyces chromofuscus]|nr:hypothetical protein GCM10010254_16920 [Streptomyces chromofuscus]